MITSEINTSKPVRASSTSSLLSTTLENILDIDDSLKITESVEKNAEIRVKERNPIENSKSEAAKNYTNSVYEKILDKYLNKSLVSDKSDLQIDTHFENILCVRIILNLKKKKIFVNLFISMYMFLNYE